MGRAVADAVGGAVEAAVLRAYAALPKNGKPQAHEYTLLAGFAVTDDDETKKLDDGMNEGDDDVGEVSTSVRVVALGTGTKCLSGGARCAKGEAGLYTLHESS
jgi:hypothetical protein